MLVSQQHSDGLVKSSAGSRFAGVAFWCNGRFFFCVVFFAFLQSFPLFLVPFNRLEVVLSFIPSLFGMGLHHTVKIMTTLVVGRTSRG